MSSDVEEIRQRLGGLSVNELQALKKLADNEIKSRTILDAMSFRAGERVLIERGVIDTDEIAGTVEYANKMTVAVRLDASGESIRVYPSHLRRVGEGSV